MRKRSEMQSNAQLRPCARPMNAACGAHGCVGVTNVHKRYLIHVAGFNLGILMRALFGLRHAEGRAASAKTAILFVIQFDAMPWRSPSWRTSKANQQYSSIIVAPETD